MFRKILVANRGEIAIRIMRACRELGVQTVAVYSEADKNAQHVQFADEALCIGGAAPKESYLNADVIIRAALDSKADAIHPGYGFLSENAAFAADVESANLTFIGPAADSIRAMGDKAASKILMKQANVPTVPGVEGLETYDEFKKAADEIGYPVLIKASAGGGGKGMRVVSAESELKEAIELARSEARNAFGDERLLIEKYLEDAHHIEIQVFGDKHGNLVHLFERECSVQRRHQKIIEESPSPLLTPELREQMGAAAVKAAKAVGYYNAGTVEFIFDSKPSTLNLKPSFYFLEMNTRLQVEHPVTEMVSGLDLVHWQIRVAAGEAFPFAQSDLCQHGHAIECRIYAEDPAGGFLPSTGKLLQFIPPQGPGIRVDSGFAVGDEVTHFYDPLLAKLIVRAESRADAIVRMENALADFIVHGVTTNIDFMRAVLATDDFRQGKVSTRWVEEKFGAWSPAPADALTVIAAALADVVFVGKAQSAVSNESDPFSPWKQTGNYRN
ncbi:MAG: acetyl-CoA carboxylase biotin carboxylase subunit [Anaerolineales bacterium]|nr:acetyl-CoA carboxylase biotin carboxylase subunit [Anaerolineales bacterium]